jgi:hypothetical protein
MTTGWIRAALGLWVVGIVVLAISLAVLHKQIRLFGTEGPASASYRRVSLLDRALGAATGLVVVGILYLMVLVFKPGA